MENLVGVTKVTLVMINLVADKEKNEVSHFLGQQQQWRCSGDNMYNWGIGNAKFLFRDESDRERVITTLKYYVSKTQGSWTVVHEGEVDLPPPGPDFFIEWDGLNNETLVLWAKENLGAEKVTEIEEGLDQELYEKTNPTWGWGTPWDLESAGP